jgi:hypothetical protein
MNATVITYALYLLISVAMTIWVARTLHRNGRLFLVRSFGGDEGLADSVNHLLVVGFYLINTGFIALFLKLKVGPETIEGVFEAISGKVGVVLLVLGAMHFFNLYVFHRLNRRYERRHAPPPVEPDDYRALETRQAEQP